MTVRINRAGKMFSINVDEEGLEAAAAKTSNTAHRALMGRMLELCSGLPQYEALLRYMDTKDAREFVTEEEIRTFRGNIERLASSRAAAVMRKCRQLCADDPEFQRLAEVAGEAYA